MSRMDRESLQRQYEESARAYMRRLSDEPFGQSITQATQRKITLESLDLIHARRPDIQVFDELPIQYSLPGRASSRQVIADNLIVIFSKPIVADSCFDLLTQPVGPYCVVEYASERNPRKNYEENKERFERELRVPFFLHFQTDNRDLVLYHHNKRKYVSVKPNKQGRIAIPKLELELALLDGWVRFWCQGELLPLPAELLRDRDDARKQADDARSHLDEERRGRLAAEDELAQLRAEVARSKQRRKNGS